MGCTAHGVRVWRRPGIGGSGAAVVCADTRPLAPCLHPLLLGLALQAAPQLSPGAALMPCGARLVGLLAESQDLVDTNQVVL